MKNTTQSSVSASGAGTATLSAPGISPTLLNSISTPQKAELIHPGIKEQLESATGRDADIVIIGSGPAGYVAAIRAAQLGARTVIIEKGEVGGTCLNVGCIPTKALLGCIAVLDHVKEGAKYGVDVQGYTLSIPTMMDRKQRIVKQLTSGVEGLFRKNKVRLVRGDAQLQDAHTVVVKTDKGDETITANNVLIATGSVTARLPLPGLEIGGRVWTSTEALSFETAPKKMLIIGAGAIGLEAGYTFARLGTEVLVVEMMPQILPAADTETARILQKSLESKGMKFLTGATVTRAEDVKGGKRAYIKCGDKEEAQDFDAVLVAVGRRAAIKDIGLEKAGVKTDGRRILVDDHCRTNVPGVYAAGDCIGEPMLAHVGWTESIVAVENMMGMDSKMDYRAFPACVYTTPECASVGLTEEQARERFKEVRVGKFSFSHNGKSMAIGEAEGFIKFVTEPRYGQILGVHMVGPHVTDLITEMVLALQNELTVDEVVKTIHPHPTLSEVVQESGYDAQGRAIHK